MTDVKGEIHYSWIWKFIGGLGEVMLDLVVITGLFAYEKCTTEFDKAYVARRQVLK